MLKKIMSLLILSLNINLTTAQNILVSGSVTDDKAQTLSGVSVTAIGVSGLSTLSNSAGKYEISVPKEVKKISFSYINKKTEIVNLSTAKNQHYDVTLMPILYGTEGFGLSFGHGFTRMHIDVDASVLGYDTTVVLKMKPLIIQAHLHKALQKSWEQEIMFEASLHILKDADERFDNEGVVSRFSLMTVSNKHWSLRPKLNAFAGVGALLQYTGKIRTISAGLRIQSGFAFPVKENAGRILFFSELSGGKIKSFDVITGMQFRFSVTGLSYEYIF